jgi:hypothetical protein
MVQECPKIKDNKIREITEELLMSTDELVAVLLAAVLLIAYFFLWRTSGLA